MLGTGGDGERDAVMGPAWWSRTASVVEARRPSGRRSVEDYRRRAADAAGKWTLGSVVGYWPSAMRFPFESDT